MKNRIITGIVLISILYACGDKDKKNSSTHKEQTDGKRDYVTIEGNIKTGGDEKDKIYLLVDPLSLESNVIRKMFLDKNGHFKDSIHHIRPGYYVLMNTSDKAINLYLKDGDYIKIKTNALSSKSFMDSMKVSGGKINSFLLDYERFKQDNFNDNIKTLFSLDEETFKIKMDSLKQRSLSYVRQYKGLSNSERKTAEDNIIYGWGLILNNYPAAHTQMKQDRNYKPSKSYYDYTKEIDINNVPLFKSNIKYQDYVLQELNRRIANTYQPVKGKSHIDYFIKKLKQDSVKTYIKDFMLLELANQEIFHPSPSYQQYAQSVIQNFQAQVQAFKRKNPKAKVPDSAAPTKEQIQKGYKEYTEQYNKLYEKEYSKIWANIETPELKEILKNNNTTIKGLKKGDKAPEIQVLKDDRPENLITLNKGKNLLIYFWSTSSDNTTRFFDDYNNLVVAFAENPNIAFATVNIDYKNKKEKWLLTIKEKKLKGQHYMAFNDWDTPFFKSYGFSIRSFPRFVLINREGNILMFDAPKPGDKALKKALSDLAKTD